MRKLTIILSALLCSFNALAESPAASPATPTVIRFSHILSKDSAKNLAVETFKSLVEKYSNGQIKVENYPNNTLFDDRSELKALLAGKVEMIAPATGKLDALYKDKSTNPYVILDMPYIFESNKEILTINDNKVLDSMSQTLNGSGVKALGIWSNGFKKLSTDKKINNFEDLKDLKVRLQSSTPILRAQMDAWKTIPRVMTLAETYTGLVYSTLDSTETTFSNFYGAKLYESQKYLYNTNHGYLGYAWLVNEKFFNKLSADSKAVVMKAISETNVRQGELAILADDLALQDIKDTGLTRILDFGPSMRTSLATAIPESVATLSPVQKEFYTKLKDSLGHVETFQK